MADDVETHWVSRTNTHWVDCDITQLGGNLANEKELRDHVKSLEKENEISYKAKQKSKQLMYPELMSAGEEAVNNMINGLMDGIANGASVAGITPCTLLNDRKVLVAKRFAHAIETTYHTKNHLASTNAAGSEAEGGATKDKTDEDGSSKSLQSIVIESGILNGLQVGISLMKQSWMQLKWQEDLTRCLQSHTPTLVLPSLPNFHLAKQALQMILENVKSYPAMLFSKKLPKVFDKCINELWNFLKWVICTDDCVSPEEKQMALEVMMRMCLLYGSLSKLMEWIQEMLQLLAENFIDKTHQPLVSVSFYHEMLQAITDGVFTYSTEISNTDDLLEFSPREQPQEGFAHLLDVLVDLCKKLSWITSKVTSYFESQQGDPTSSSFKFLSKHSTVYAAGSNSSLQLALGSVEKVHVPRVMEHMADAQYVEAGLYCTMIVHADGSVQGCGKGSNGRLGLGDSDNRATLTPITTFPEGVKIFQISQAKSGDGHCLAITNTGQVYSWGEGSYGRLGHGDTVTIKTPKRVEALKDVVVVQVSCGSRHSAAVTADGVLYTWGSGTDGKLGHGNTESVNTPKVLSAVSNAMHVACAASHSVAIAENGSKVYSWGGGSYGKLGHGNTSSQNTPKLIEALKSHQCVKVVSGSNYTAILTSTGRVLTMGNSAACGAGTSEPRRYTPEPVIGLSEEHIVDIAGGDTMMLALTLRGEVYSWGSNSMGQVGQGTDVGSTVSTPGKMLGLDGVSIQQISAGTSHALMWTAIPSRRKSTHIWSWPYCIDTSEKTFKSLVTVLSTYGDLSSSKVMAPFTSLENQWEFVFDVLKLISRHMALVAPVGVKCIKQTLGSQVKPLREFVLKLFNSQDIPVKMQESLITLLQTGSTMLVPSIRYRLELLSTLIPQSPSQFSSLSKGQMILLKVLLKEFTKSTGATAALVIEASDNGGTADDKLLCNKQIESVIDLCNRMMLYIVYDTAMAISQLAAPPDEQETSSRCNKEIVDNFTQFVFSILYHFAVHCVTMMEQEANGNIEAMQKLESVKKFSAFINMLTEFVFQLVDKSVELGSRCDGDVVTQLGHLLFQSVVNRMLSGVLLLTRCGDEVWCSVFMELYERIANALQPLVKFVPHTLLSNFAQVETEMKLYDGQISEVELSALFAGANEEAWYWLLSLIQMTNHSIGIAIKGLHNGVQVSSSERDKQISSICNSYVVSNGLCVDGVAEALTVWLAMSHIISSSASDDYCEHINSTYRQIIASTNLHDMPFAELENKSKPTIEELQQHISSDDACLQLALGHLDNEAAKKAYTNMMSMAKLKDWNTCTDEEVCPQLKKVSCAALACFLKHTGQQKVAKESRSRPKKALIDVYRSVFALRKIVFGNRPIKSSEEDDESEYETAVKEFEECCSMVCSRLFFIMQMVTPVITDGGDRIVPLTSSSGAKPKLSRSRRIGSPIIASPKKPGFFRLGSQPLSSQSEYDFDTRSDSIDFPNPFVHTSSVDTQETFDDQEFSLNVVKDSLRRLKWQKERIAVHVDTMSSTSSSQTIQRKMCDAIVEFVRVINVEDMLLVSLLNALKHNKIRAEHRLSSVKLLQQKMLAEIPMECVLLDDSTKFITLASHASLCPHYLENIKAASSVVQRDIKLTFEVVFQHIIKCWLKDGSDVAIKDNNKYALLGLSLLSFCHDHTDVQLLIHSGVLQLLSDLVSSRQEQLNAASDEERKDDYVLNERVILCSSQLLQLIAIRTGERLDVLKSTPEVIRTMLNSLYHQLNIFSHSTTAAGVEPSYVRVNRLSKLFNFMLFLKMLFTNFGGLMEFADVSKWLAYFKSIATSSCQDTMSKVAKKTILLSIQLLGELLVVKSNEISQETEIQELLQMLANFMFTDPKATCLQYYLEAMQQPNYEIVAIENFTAGDEWIGCSSESRNVIVFSNSDSVGCAYGACVSVKGESQWSVKCNVAKGAFSVGISHKPLDLSQPQSSDHCWLLNCYTSGCSAHSIPPDANCVDVDDEIVLTYDGVAKQLSIVVNDVEKTFTDITGDVYPVVVLDHKENNTVAKVTVSDISYKQMKTRVLPATVIGKVLSNIYPASQPLLASFSATLVSNVINLLRKLQEHNHWKQSIANAVSSRINAIHKPLSQLEEFCNGSLLDSVDRQLEVEAASVTCAKLQQLCHDVCPALLIVGGYDAYLSLGRPCTLPQSVVSDIGFVPDYAFIDSVGVMSIDMKFFNSKTNVEQVQGIQGKSDIRGLQPIPPVKFDTSLIIDKITPQALNNLVKLAGFVQNMSNGLLSKLQDTNQDTSPPSSLTFETADKIFSQMLEYQSLQLLMLQFAAIKCCEVLLQEGSLLSFLAPNVEEKVVAIDGDVVDPVVMMEAMKGVVKNLVVWATRPSPMIDPVTIPDLDRLHSCISHRTLFKIVQELDGSEHHQSQPTADDVAGTLSTPEALNSVAVEAPPPAPPPPPIGPLHQYRSPSVPIPPPPPPPVRGFPYRGVASHPFRTGPPAPPVGVVPPAPPLPPRNILRATRQPLLPASPPIPPPAPPLPPLAPPLPPPPPPPPPPVARSPTPPMVTMLMEMGFDRPLARIAVERCENFDDTRPPDENIDVLLNWILGHPDAVEDEERRLEEEEERQRAAAATDVTSSTASTIDSGSGADQQFLKLMNVGVASDNVPIEETSARSRPDFGDTKHAPNLLEGPSVDDEVPDMMLGTLNKSHESVESLLAALKLTRKNPTLNVIHFFSTVNQLGSFNADDDGTVAAPAEGEEYRVTANGEMLLHEAVALKSAEENLFVLSQLNISAQLIVARRILVSVMSFLENKSYELLSTLNLTDIQNYIRLLQLSAAGRFGNPSNCTTLSNVKLSTAGNILFICKGISKIVSKSEESAQKLVEACSRDLFILAVGGVSVLEKSKALKASDVAGKVSELSVLCNPPFSVTRYLVEIAVKSFEHFAPAGHACFAVLADALASCMYSSKLQRTEQAWATEQLLTLFAFVSKKSSKSRIAVDMFKEEMTHYEASTEIASICSSTHVSQDLLTMDCVGQLSEWKFNEKSEPEVLGGLKKQDGLNDPQSLILSHALDSYGCVAVSLGKSLYILRQRDHKTCEQLFPTNITSHTWAPAVKDNVSGTILVGEENGTLSEVTLPNICTVVEIDAIVTPMAEKFNGAINHISPSADGKCKALFTANNILVMIQQNQEKPHCVDFGENNSVDEMLWIEDDTLVLVNHDGAVQFWSATNGSVVCTLPENNVSTAIVKRVVATDDSANCISVLISGHSDGTVRLWQYTNAEVDLIVTLGESRSSPVTALTLTYTCSLLAVGDEDGRVSVWDMEDASLLKYSKLQNKVTQLQWIKNWGLAVCTANSKDLHVYKMDDLANDCEEDRYFRACLPVLSSIGVTDLTSIPCLSALLKNLHLSMKAQYAYEEEQVVKLNTQLVHSKFLQHLISLAFGLGIVPVILRERTHLFLKPVKRLDPSWQWLKTCSNCLNVVGSFAKRSKVPDDFQYLEPEDGEAPLSDQDPKPMDNGAWTFDMDKQIIEWIMRKPEHWRTYHNANVYTWGKGQWHQLGHSTDTISLPAKADGLNEVEQVVAGHYCTYGIQFDGLVLSFGDGGYGRLGHGSSESQNTPRIISGLLGVRVVQVVAGSKSSASSNDGYALALTDNGDVYSWGKGYNGRLGHKDSSNCNTPKLVDAFVSENVIQLSTFSYHCAAVTSDGKLFTFGSMDSGKLGAGTGLTNTSPYKVYHITKFYEPSNLNVALPTPAIGYVACGEKFTLVITQDGTSVFGFGVRGNGQFGRDNWTPKEVFVPVLLDHLTPHGPFKKVFAGASIGALLTQNDRLIVFGRMVENGEYIAPSTPDMLEDVKITTFESAQHYFLAVSDSGQVYSWGENSGGTCQLGYEQTSFQRVPKLVPNLSNVLVKQISAGTRHVCASDVEYRFTRGKLNVSMPQQVPAEYTGLKEVSCAAIYHRYHVLHHLSTVITSSWKFFSRQLVLMQVNHFDCEEVRHLILPSQFESIFARVVTQTMGSKEVGPEIKVSRFGTNSKESVLVLPQIASQVLALDPASIRCKPRAWKVHLAGEGADDAGGVFDETIAQMCEEMENGKVNLLIPTPNGQQKVGFNQDRFVFNPACTSEKDLQHLKFLGILFGVAIRTKKPVQLHIAPPMWKLLVGMSMTAKDLEDIDLTFTQSLMGIRDIDKSGVTEDTFSEVIPLNSFEALSITGKFVPIIPGGSHIRLTFANRKEYCEKALQFRLRELDVQVAAIREGMSLIIPVPLLSLCSGQLFETYVCGSEFVDVAILKKVVKYRDISESDQLVTWLWQTLESFTNEERLLFLRFVSGRSRLPANVNDISQRFQIMKWGKSPDSLPTSQTCFFQIRLPSYSSQAVMAERLRYAITHCRSIDMDNYMLTNRSDYDDDDDDDSDGYYS